MLSTLDLNSVSSFLNICKKEIAKGNCYFVGYRNINMNGKLKFAKQALLDLGIFKIKDIWDHILTLNVNDCINVSSDNDIFRDMNSEVYEFLKTINSKNVYIKLTLNDKG